MQTINKVHKPHFHRGSRRWTYMKRKRNKAHRHAYKQRLKKYDGVEEPLDEPIPLKPNETLTSWDLW